MNDVLACPRCGRRNRIRAAASGLPHCAACGTDLPWLVEADDATFADVTRADVPVLVDFWAPWCGPCRMVAPTLEQLARDLAGRLKVVKVNTDQSPATPSRFGVQGIPTLVLMRAGREVDRVTGALPAPQLRAWVERAA